MSHDTLDNNLRSILDSHSLGVYLWHVPMAFGVDS